MTASQIIEEIKALDPDERAQVLDSLLKFETSQPERVLGDSKFDRGAEGVLDRHAELMRRLAQ